MKHLVFAVVILMALATAASATTVCSGVIQDGDTCSYLGFNIVWQDVVNPMGPVSVVVSGTATDLTLSFTSSALVAGIVYEVTPLNPEFLASGITLTSSGVSSISKAASGSLGGTLTGGAFSANGSKAFAGVAGETLTVVDAWSLSGPGSAVSNTISFVPEPASIMLIGCGLVGLGLIRRRRA